MKSLGLKDLAYLGAVSGGGGGGGYADEPDNYAGLIRWYQASSYSDDGLSDEDPVVNDWTDLSATGDDATPDGSNAPRYKTSFMPTGKPCLYFPSQHHFDFTEISFGDLTVLAVWKTTALSRLLTANGSTTRYISDEQGGNPAQTGPSIYFSSGSDLDGVSAQTNNVWKVTGWRRTSSTGVPRFSHGKTHFNETESDTNTNALLLDAIGVPIAVTTNFYLAELCIYSSVLADANIESLYDSYFNVKYLGDIGS